MFCDPRMQTLGWAVEELARYLCWSWTIIGFKDTTRLAIRRALSGMYRGRAKRCEGHNILKIIHGGGFQHGVLSVSCRS